MHWLKLPLYIFCYLTGFSVNLSADILVFAEGGEITLNSVGTGTIYHGVGDVELRGAEPGINFNTGSGSNSFTLDGSDGGLPTHVAIRFDDIFGDAVHQIPLGAQIDSAQLTLNITNEGDDFSIHQIADGFEWDAFSATWNQFGQSNNDGIQVGTETTADSIISSGTTGKQNIDVTAIMTAWSEGAANAGFALIPGGSNGVDFHTSETDVSTERPTLTVSYTRIDPNTPSFTESSYFLTDARAGLAYNGTLADKVTDLDNDPVVFIKESGPDWLNIASNGSLSGLPGNASIGQNTFTVRVSDDDGNDVAIVYIPVNDENGNPLPSSSNTARYRLVWLNDPASTITVAWDQLSGADATVYYGTNDEGRITAAYPFSKSVDRATSYRGMRNRFARLTNLLPDTTYYFVLQDEAGVSERFSFRTASDSEKPFTFIVGGDSRNNRTPRQHANQLVAKLRPLFVAFTGDMISSDNDQNWIEWMDDWQMTISRGGRMYPILPHRGNHETGGNPTIYNLFDTTETNFYSINFGGNLLRYYVLNSESAEETQTDWLQADLDAAGGNDAFVHLCAGYHKPMRPHTSSKSEGSSEYSAWAELFYTNRFDLIFESDSHMMKRTYPVRPYTGSGSEEGFIRDDIHGTTFTGEGCWGAPLRDANDAKSWTAAAGSFNGFDWVHVYPNRLEVFTVQADTAGSVNELSDETNRSLPQGIGLWRPASGVRLVAGTRGSAVRDSFAQWQLNHFGTSIEANETPYSDTDGDTYDNLTEFAFGLNPTMPDRLAYDSLPHVENSNGQPTLHFLRPVDSGIRYLFESSSDLSTWTMMSEGTDYALSTAPNGTNENITLTLLGPLAQARSTFIRVRLAQ